MAVQSQMAIGQTRLHMEWAVFGYPQAAARKQARKTWANCLWSRGTSSSIQQNESTRFIVIVNPGNGPGPEAVPDANYLSEIPKLTAYSNVDVVGYVHTTFARRPLSMVMNDITTYSNWAAQTQYPGLAINGIFVDETPNQYDTRTERYLADLTEFAKTCGGFGGDKLVCAFFSFQHFSFVTIHAPKQGIFLPSESPPTDIQPSPPAEGKHTFIPAYSPFEAVS